MHLTILLLTDHTHPTNYIICPDPQANVPVDVLGPCILVFLPEHLGSRTVGCNLIAPSSSDTDSFPGASEAPVYLQLGPREPGTPSCPGSPLHPPPAAAPKDSLRQPGPSDVSSARAAQGNQRGAGRPEPLAPGRRHPVPDAPGALQSLERDPSRQSEVGPPVRLEPRGSAEGEAAQAGPRARGAPSPAAPLGRPRRPRPLPRFPAPGPAWRPARGRRPDPGPVRPWPSGGKRRGCGSAEERPPRLAAATQRTASLRSRRKMTPGPRR